MSSAFTRESDSGIAEDVGERPVSTHRNLVTPRGFEAIEQELEASRVALAKAEREAITGKAVTPFLLSEIGRATGGRALAANIALVRNNARLAARIAVELAKG